MAKHLVIAGHGKTPEGNDPGAMSADRNYSEAELVRSLADKIKAIAGGDIDTYTEKDVFTHGIIGQFGGYDTITELHMNAFDQSAKGIEVLIHKDLEPDAIDQRIQSGLAALFTNRGIRKRGGLYNMRKAKDFGWNYRLVETCFIDSQEDLAIYLANERKIALIIAEAITGKEYGKAEWVKHTDGRWWYRFADGTYPRHQWLELAGTWYWFNDEGYMVTGWQGINGVWYYFNEYGAMQTGWQQLDGKWYHLRKSGAMTVGWLQENDKWFFLKDNGEMAANGWCVIGNAPYLFEASGEMVTGFTMEWNAQGQAVRR